MAATFLLEVVTPERMFFSEEVESLIFKTPEGEIGILKSHSPMVAAVVSSSIRIKQNDGWKTASVASGFVEVLGEKVVLLVDSAEWPDEIDVNRALEAKKRAEERLQKSLNSQEQAQSQAALARALARLSATGK